MHHHIFDLVSLINIYSFEWSIAQEPLGVWGETTNKQTNKRISINTRKCLMILIYEKFIDCQFILQLIVVIAKGSMYIISPLRSCMLPSLQQQTGEAIQSTNSSRYVEKFLRSCISSSLLDRQHIICLNGSMHCLTCTSDVRTYIPLWQPLVRILGMFHCS